jgi:hypothetical protein
MGAVYEAVDEEQGQSVAIKTLLSFSPSTLYRLKQEFRTLADLQHPNLVRLYELVVSETDGAFFAMELVRGTDFLSYVHRERARRPYDGASRVTEVAPVARGEGSRRTEAQANEASAVPPDPSSTPADIDRLRSALRQIVKGVHALHSAGKLHRDIKPSNVLVTHEGRVVILDFGVATEMSSVANRNFLGAVEIVGTMHYMAPEQALAGDPTPAADWYSVGVVLYEALVGRVPFLGEPLDVISMKALNDPPPAMACVRGVPPDLDALCRALLDRDPAQRPDGAEILRLLGDDGSTRPSDAPAVRINSSDAKLVGREDQLRRLVEAFEAVVAGRPTTVWVAGESGMGKSAIVQLFLDRLVGRDQAVVFRGRAYERESVPFKAVDSVIDALGRHLITLQEQGDAIVLPSAIEALARVFPVLGGVAGLDAVPQGPVSDPQLVRRLAFAALRELVATLTLRRPLVVYIDDAHWGDTDSAALLHELTRQPLAPPMLLVMTYRDDLAESSAFLAEMRKQPASGPGMCEVSVGPLTPEEGELLALALLQSSGVPAQRLARAVARESRGSPFLIEELVRSNRGTTARFEGETLATITLDQMVRERLHLLSEAERALLEIVAVGARPLPVSVVAEAAGHAGSMDEAIGVLSTRRFLRVGLRDGREVVETSHDRFRETIVALLPPEKLRERHGRLARALAAAPGVDAEAVAMHLLGAGERERAAQYAERAAEQAATKLAFDQAARLLRVTLGAIDPSSPDTRRLRKRLAQVLEWAGRSAEAARAYEEAAVGAPPLERAQLERAAAVELLACGRIEEGTAKFHRVLDAVGLAAPRSRAAAVFWLLVHRARLWLWFVLGHRVKERPSGDVAPEARARVDAMSGAATGFAVTDVLLSTCMSVRSVMMALRTGEGPQIVRAAVLEASKRASTGGRVRGLERALVATAERIAGNSGRPDVRITVRHVLGINAYLRGHWKTALEMLDTGVKSHSHTASWQSNSNVFACWSLNFLGRHRELTRRHTSLIADAEQRGDMYTSVQLRDGSLAIVWLAADDPDAAHRNAREAIALWPRDRYLLQHWHLMFGEAETELYLGRGARAYARVERDAYAIEKNYLLKVQHVRGQTTFLRARCAIASIDDDPAHRAERLAETQNLARALDNERMAWTAPFVAIVRAGAANASGHPSAAIAALRSAIDLAQAADMEMYAACARYQLGRLLGGTEGEGLVQQAEESMAAQDIRRPERFASILVPGSWSK